MLALLGRVRRRVHPLLGLWLALAAPEAAHAAWLEASSPHFVIYADDAESDIRRFSAQLERYHAAMTYVTGWDIAEPSPSGRVTVYVVRSEAEVRRLHGSGSAFVAGFYLPRAGGSLAIVPRSDTGGRTIDFAMVALLHEYAHHFMISTSPMAMPRWVSEGSAEFFASAKFGPDGSVSIGMPAQHRAMELFHAKDVTATDLLDPEAYEKRRGRTYDAYYGKSWLLFHYLTFEPSRQGQLRTYMQAIAQGSTQQAAAREAFGDPAVLEKELDQYLLRTRMKMMKLSPDKLSIGSVSVRRLGQGEAAIMNVVIRSRRGVNEERAPKVLADARRVAAAWPGDAAVQSALAEAEYDAGNDAEAIAAADAALAIDPARVNAYVQKGYALFRQAAAASDKAAAYKRALAPFLRLNALENDHPLPLIYFFRAQVEQGLQPTELAVRGLRRAVELAPFDAYIRFRLAREQIRMGQRDEARGNLSLLAYNPHGGRLADTARAMIERLDREPGWNGSGIDIAGDEPDGE